MPAKNESQRRLFAMVRAYKRGKLKKAPAKIKEVSKHVSDTQAGHFSKKTSKSPPEHKKEASRRLQFGLLLRKLKGY